MSLKFHLIRRAATVFNLGAFLVFASGTASGLTLTNITIRVMAANLTSGNNQCYEAPGIRIFQGLKPDVVAIQEFNYGSKPSSAAQIRSLVDTAFGTNFVYFRESSATENYTIPNGIISRYPFIQTGTWDDTLIPDRGYAWARIDLPGTNDLYVVSVHLKASSGSASTRSSEATNLKNLIQASFPAGAWIVVAGDFNIHSTGEAALSTFKTFLSDHPIPTDAVSGGDPDTNANRTERYDYVLPSFSLTNALTHVVLASRSFPNGLVFDSAVYTPLSDVAPVAAGDSHVSGMQHMAVVKDFRIAYVLTNPVTPPSITGQPGNQMASQADIARFTVTAAGTAPLGYQWHFNGNPLAGETASSFVRNNAQPADQGSYFVIVSNAAGSVTSAPATLQLIVPRPMLTLPAPGLLEWAGLSNLSYTVQSRTNLELGDWQILGRTSSPTGHLTFPIPETGTAQQFFRVLYP